MICPRNHSMFWSNVHRFQVFWKRDVSTFGLTLLSIYVECIIANGALHHIECGNMIWTEGMFIRTAGYFDAQFFAWSHLNAILPFFWTARRLKIQPLNLWNCPINAKHFACIHFHLIIFLKLFRGDNWLTKTWIKWLTGP